jgi:hypothetical protein
MQRRILTSRQRETLKRIVLEQIGSRTIREDSLEDGSREAWKTRAVVNDLLREGKLSRPVPGCLTKSS